MIKAVLFDLGGTLHVCSNSPERKVWFAQRLIERLADYGMHIKEDAPTLARQLDVNMEIYKHESEETLKELPSEIIWNDYYLKEQNFGRARLKPLAEELSFLNDYERTKNIRRPHLTECMQTLKEMGFRMGMISNIISRSIVPHFLAEYGLTDYMECVITSAATGIRKPSAEIFRVAERAMNLAPDELAYVGDTLSRDVRGVRNAGWKCMIQIDNPGIAHRDKGITGVKPDYRILDLMEVPDILAREAQR